MDNYFIAHLNLVVAVNPHLVAEVESAEYIELTCSRAIIRNVECTIAISWFVGKFNFRNFTFEIYFA